MTTRTTYREVLALREFRAVLAAHVASLLGTVVAQVALSLLVYERTDSPLLAAATFALGWLPFLLVGTLLSGLPDRYPVRRLLVGSDLVAAGLVALMTIPGLPTWALLALVAAVGCVTPVFGNARAAVLPDLLPGDTYVLGRALLGSLSQASLITGYAVGGLLVTVLGPRGALAVDAASFVLSALLLRLGTADRPARHDPADRPSLVGDSLAGIGELLRDRRVRAVLLLGWLPPLTGVAGEAVGVPYADAVGSGGGPGAGVLLASVAVGVLLGEVLTPRLLGPATRVRVLPWQAVLMSLPLVGLATAPPVPAAAALLALAGLGWGAMTTQAQLLLDVLPEHLRTRGLSVAGTGVQVGQAVGFLGAGAVAEVLGPPRAAGLLGAVGAALTVAVLLAWRAGGRPPTGSPPRARAA